MAVIVFFQNPLDTEEREIYSAEAGTNLQQWLDNSGFSARMRQQPLLVLLNGTELMAEDYDRELQADDKVAIAAQAESIDPFTIFLIVMAVTSVALVLTMPEPAMPGGDMEEASPTYSLSARGNRARLDQPKPVLYGTMRVYPDLASKPYSEYDANSEQHVYQLFEVTQGEANVDESTARFEDTNLSSFDNYEIETIAPGAAPTLFPSIVDVSSEVSSLELTDANLGPYSANPAATTVTRLAVDMVAPGGIYKVDNKDGKLRNYKVQYKLQARAIDDLDVPTGAWFDLGTHTMSGASRDAIRRTHFYTVAADRYEVQAIRLTAESSKTNISDTINWTQLKGYIADTTVTSTTRIAVKIRASEQIGNKALSKFNVVASRKLKTWASGTGWTASPVLTNNPCWAFADALRGQYGGNRSDAYIDLVKLEALAPTLDTEGVEFNGVFDRKGTLWDALTSIMMPARCRPVDKQGLYTVVRDSSQTVPVQMFTMRNIVRDSFKINHIGVLEETADSIRIEFMDKGQDYRPAQFTATLTGGTTNNPRDVKLFGITDKDEAFKIAQWMNAQNFYRRERYTFETGIEGRIPFYGDLISISHFMLGQQDAVDLVSGEVVAFDGVDVLTLTEDVDHIATPYIIVRDLEGAPTNAWTCTAISKRQVRVTDGAFDAGKLNFDQGYERPHFTMGEGSTFSTTAKVEKISPAAPGRVRIECFADNANVYTAADGLSVPPITQLPAAASIVPVVSELSASVQGTDSDPVVYLTWHGDNADYYEVEYSTDAGVTYLPAETGRTLEQKFIHVPPAPGVVHYRVAGVNLFRGAWKSLQVDTNSVAFTAPLGPTALALVESFTGTECKLSWSSDVYSHLVEIWVSGVKKYFTTVGGTTYDFPASIAAEQGIGRAFDVRVYAIASNGLQSATYASLSVSNPAPAVLNNLAVTAINNQAVVTFDWPTDADLAGVSVWVSATSSFTPGAATLEVDKSVNPVLAVAIPIAVTRYIKVAALDVWGNDANYSGEYTVTGGKITTTEITDNAISTPLLAANAVTADKVLINILSAISADIGTMTAGLLKTTSGTGARVEIDSNGDFPFWIGELTKVAANGHVFYNKTTKIFTVQDPTSGMRLEMEPGGATPLWIGTGTKTASNGLLYFDGTDLHLAGNLKAAGGTFSGTLTASAIDAVDTINLKGQSVVHTESVYTSASVSLTSSWVTVATKAITLADVVADTAVLILFKANIGVSDDSVMSTGVVDFRIKRDSTVIHTDVAHMSAQGTSASGNGVILYPDAPGSSGTFTYTIQAKRSNNYTSGGCSSRALSLFAGKR